MRDAHCTPGVWETCRLYTPGVWETCRLYTPWVWEESLVYTHLGMGGEPGIYHPGTMVAILPRLYWAYAPPWVHLSSLTAAGVTSSARPGLLAVCERALGSVKEESPGWEPLSAQSPKGVIRGGTLCAELFRSSRQERMDDRITTG